MLSWRGGESMALEAAFNVLQVNLLSLQEVFGSLRLTVIEDLPEPRPPVALSEERYPEEMANAQAAQPLLVHLLGDTIDDICGMLAEATAATEQGRKTLKRHAHVD